MSTLKVDEIQNTSGTVILPSDGYTYQPGQIIEVLTGVCDGTSATVKSGEYTFPSVTGGQLLTTTYADVLGSPITYTPPTGTSRVIYEFSHQLSWTNAHAISHWKLYIDGVEVTDARHSLSGYYPERIEHHMWVFRIGSADAATGAQATWTTGKEIKLSARVYGSPNNNDKVHYTTYWDGGSGTQAQYSKPVVRITAIA